MAKGQVFVSRSGKDRIRTADPSSANQLRAEGYTPEKAPKRSKADSGASARTAASRSGKAEQGVPKKDSENKTPDKK